MAGSGAALVPAVFQRIPLASGSHPSSGLSPTGNRSINNFLGEDYWPGLHGSGREDIEPGAGMTLSEWITSTDPYTRPPTTLSLVGGQEVPAIHLRPGQVLSVVQGTSDPPGTDPEAMPQGNGNRLQLLPPSPASESYGEARGTGAGITHSKGD